MRGAHPAIREMGLPLSLNVRLVRVRLNTGEYEVLVTSLLDGYLYPTEGFLELYGLRWGIETFYGLLKTRLELETTPASVPRPSGKTSMPPCICPAWNRY